MAPGARSPAATQWAEMLARWAIPDALIAVAPESPYFFDPSVFVEIAEEAIARAQDTISDRVARGALPPHGSVLDVGVGAGAASLRLGAAHVVGVDPSRVLLDAFLERASRLAIDATAVEGTWPAVADEAPVVDVAVCHHVVYNVSDLAGFATALDGHARRRVVVELTTEHPMRWMSPYWHAVHGLAQPDRPTSDDAVAVLTELGFDVQLLRWQRRYQMIGESGDAQLARIARRLCLPAARHDELRRVLETTPPPPFRELVTLWWATS
jgi:SAM-dependent methyltransferase